MMYDVAVVGGGPGGYVAAIRAGRLGLKTILFERDRLGGVCLNRGCIPTKALLHSSQVCWTAGHAAEHGVNCIVSVIDFSRAADRKDGIVAELSGGVRGLLKSSSVQVITGEASVVDHQTIQSGGKAWQAENIILATGSKPMVPPEANGKVLTSDDFLSLRELPESMILVGGGVIGVELAAVMAGFGRKATVVELAERILPSADADISAVIRAALEKRGVQFICGAQVTEYHHNGVRLLYQGECRELQSDSVLLSVGRQPNTVPPVWESLGICCENGKVKVDTQMRTSVRNIFAVGDIVAGPMLAHKASAEGVVAAETIAGMERTMRYNRIPSCVYTLPEAAWIGMSAQEAEKIQAKIGIFPMSHNGKSMADGETDGFARLIADEKTGELLGAQLVCAHASDLIGEIALAMQAEACIEDVADFIAPHPTICEGISEAALGMCGRGIHSI